MRHIVVALLLVCGIFSAHAERRVALVIGNATYADAPLKNPVNDARDMRERLKGLGFADANIVYRENLKTGEIGALLREWRAKLTAGGDTVGLVFYAGHGVQIRGENYLPTVDARIEGEEDVPRQAVKLAEVMTVMAESRTRLNLVFLDACRNNPYARSFRDGTRGLAPERLPSGTLIAYATRPGAVAADGSGRNGVFTAQLLSHMATPGLTVDQVIRRVVRGVRAGTDSKQDPWTEGSIDEDFYLAQRTPEPIPPSPPPGPRVGQVLKDCDVCPELVVLPQGNFVMGSPDSEPERDKAEGPQRTVRISYPLAVGRHEVTQGQWKAVMGGNPSHFSSCGDDCPVEQVSWNDVQEYLKKLNARSGQTYRLLSEAEWEYAARAGTTTPFHTGKTITPAQANFDGNYTYNGSAKGVYREKTVKVGSFGANAFGLYDMHGNVWEWVQDVWHDSYTGAPTDGAAWEAGGDSSRRVLRGGSWYDNPRILRSAYRNWGTPGFRDVSSGFRIARTF
ncbi:MAG: hypothetical protein RL456_1172 [Pseudomonadota bacterium]|jgi:formylglycine-generating enzyme required for sulfatase activity